MANPNDDLGEDLDAQLGEDLDAALDAAVDAARLPPTPPALAPHRAALVEKRRATMKMDPIEVKGSAPAASVKASGLPMPVGDVRPEASGTDAFMLSSLNAGAAPAGGIPAVLGLEDLARDIGGKPVGGAPNPVDLGDLGTVADRAYDLYDTGVRAPLAALSDPKRALSKIGEFLDGKGTANEQAAHYRESLGDVREEHPVASAGGNLAVGVASGPQNLGQAAFGGALQTIPYISGDPEQDFKTVTAGGALGGLGYKAPVLTGAGLAGYGVATGDAETAISGAFGVGAGGAGKLVPLANRASKAYGAKADRAMGEAVGQRAKVRDDAADKLANIEALITERQGKLPEIAEGRAAQAKGAELDAAGAKQAYDAEVTAAKQQYQKALADMEAQVKQAEGDLSAAQLAHIENLQRQHLAELNQRIDQAMDVYNKATSSLHEQYDVPKNTKAWMDEVKDLGGKLRDNDAYDAKTQELVRAMDTLQRSREGKIGRAAQGDYAALAQMKQMFTPEQIEQLRQTPQGRDFLTRVEEGAANWAQERVKQPPGKDQADFELAGQMQDLMKQYSDHIASGRDRIVKSKEPARLVEAEEALASLKARGLQPKGMSDAQFVATWNAFREGKTGLPNFDDGLELQPTAALDYRTKAVQEARKAGLDESFDNIDPAPGDYVIDPKAPRRKLRTPSSYASAAPAKPAAGEPTVTLDPKAKAKNLPKVTAQPPEYIPKKDLGPPELKEGMVLEGSDIPSRMGALEQARGRLEKARSGGPDLDQNPKVAKAKTRAEKAREMARLKKERADRAAEVVKDPSKDPLVKRRLAAQERSKRTVSEAEEKMNPENILEEGKAAIQKDKDLKHAARPSSVGDLVGKVLPGPSKETMRDPAARAAWFRELERRLEPHPTLERFRKIIPHAALRADPQEAEMIANQIMGALKREEGSEE